MNQFPIALTEILDLLPISFRMRLPLLKSQIIGDSPSGDGTRIGAGCLA
ncbi:hypothetical protein [Bacillus sp. NTK034]|nr:hypothetical protein [Bacillus sp. NTK034]MBN8203351.1 hypothetical protein [Bacillus sp. NTK034]